ncbi:dihydrodipicolinate synthase family protein [Paenibacillus sp. CC-CFT747]|nr:dihydrodipicolinate synthase family protein [Paenibacillus sp. CC-CFT747]
MVTLYDQWRSGNLEEARLNQQELGPIRKLMQMGTLPSALKEMVTQLGIEVGPPRLPVQPVSPEIRQRIKEGLKAAGLGKESNRS